MKRPACTLISYAYALNDPTPRNAAISLRDAGFDVTIVTHRRPNGIVSPVPEGISVREGGSAAIYERLGKVGRYLRWRAFQSTVRRTIRETKPEVIVAVMFHAIAALPESAFRDAATIACIYDIPDDPTSGRLDAACIRKSWNRLNRFDVVWASDPLKAALTFERGALSVLPIVCLNCPRTDVHPAPAWPRDPWLANRLREEGLIVPENGSCIVLRAGAIGEACGIDETIESIRRLPAHVFGLFMGRPNADYRQAMTAKIKAAGLSNRIAFWDRPHDDDWNRALLGADIGHLIHGPYADGPQSRMFALNSSLSNYRLFNYMAAGLPILSYDDPRLNRIHDEIDCFRVCRMNRLVEDLTDHIGELSANAELRERLGRAGRLAHETRLNWPGQFEPVMNALMAMKAEKEHVRK